MRIAQITATFPPYMAGTGNVCFHNAVELARLGHRVTVYTAAGPSAEPAEDPDGIAVRRLPAVIRFGNAPLLPGLLGIRDEDILHLHLPFIFGAELVWAVSRLRNIPLVVTYHNDLIGVGFRRVLFGAYTFLSVGAVLNAARKIAVVSEDHARHCAQAPLFSRRERDVVEIPNGVDTRLFRPDAGGADIRRRHGIPVADAVVLFVAALDRAHHYKGLETLFQSFSIIPQGNTRLMIVGEGELKDHYRLRAAQLGIGDRTTFAGSVSTADLPLYYNAADIFVLPSHVLESFGMVLVEAMACGKPVIASDLPGVHSVVADGTDGFLTPPADADALAEKIRWLIDHPERGRAMGRCGRAKAESRYAWLNIAPRILRMYEDALRQAKKIT
jgi:glycosyltransferase involved in cell wall biosynthesis